MLLILDKIWCLPRLYPSIAASTIVMQMAAGQISTIALWEETDDASRTGLAGVVNGITTGMLQDL
jgi:hypothetical protein